MLMAACSVEVICISFQRTGAHRFIHSFPTRRSSDLIEIAGLPELTTVGARRGHTLDSKQFLQPAFGSGPLVGKPYGSGFYSRADYIEIVRYAAARHIEVIPEIEMPGHARAAIKSMEARSDSQYRLSDLQD